MPDINITVAHKIAVSDTTSIVCDNSDYMVHWTLDDEWSAYDTKTMRTIYMDGTYEDKVFSGSDIALPVCTVPGAVQIGLFAGNLRTSRVAILRALPSARSAAGAPADPTPDVYDQLMDLIKGLGGVDPDDIAKAVADYLAAHPIEETDPTVPEWAKAEITGATIGQIAKIAAVDASGVPTAWEPVNMAGDETWELIASGEMQEAANLEINKDSNGLPFSLKSAQIFVRGDIGITKSSFMSVQARRWASTKDYDSYFAEVLFGKENPKVNLWYMLREKTMPILFWEAEDNIRWHSADCRVLMGVRRHYSATENTFGKGPLNHLIDNVYIGAAMGNGVMAAGCKYEIWGVRA